MGVRNLADAVSKVLGPPIDPKLAMRGDIVMVDGALGICRGEKAEFLDNWQPMKRVAKAWPVKGRPQSSGDKRERTRSLTGQK